MALDGYEKGDEDEDKCDKCGKGVASIRQGSLCSACAPASRYTDQERGASASQHSQIARGFRSGLQDTTMPLNYLRSFGFHHPVLARELSFAIIGMVQKDGKSQ